ncbi:MAG: SUMF1/EgtB/PvdO family nonheme iron enzyme, partial [bacterium]|nr:SUMF1/EgtB/PvdO family nonheme iron enzyme [bacterium]
MEYIPGPTLRQKMSQQGLGHDENKVKNWIKTYFFPILEGIKAVHSKGVVHRDMKPENVLIGDEPPKIMDFGVAGGYRMEAVTLTHHVIGTITYMPEEQFLDLALSDARVDIYALGKILYEVVEGKMKKDRDKPFHQVGLNGPETPFFETLDRIIRQATARDRNQRTASVNDFSGVLHELIMDFDQAGELPRTGSKKKSNKLITGIAVSLVLLVLGLFFHFDPFNPVELGKEKHVQTGTATLVPDKELDSSQPDFSFKKTDPTQPPNTGGKNGLPRELMATDNMTMILVNGGAISLPMDKLSKEKRRVFLESFYIDKTKVTNHLYVQFLHELDGVVVRNGSVFRKGELLLLLGEVKKGYEPITFRNNVFRVKPDDAAKPVVRVTPVGALAYATYYGRSLTTMAQWQLAVRSGEQNIKKNDFSEDIRPDSEINAVTHTRPNLLGIRGLKENVHEWTVIPFSKRDVRFYIHGLDNRESFLERRPWEAFSNVGFRTVLNLEEK